MIKNVLILIFAFLLLSCKKEDEAKKHNEQQISSYIANNYYEDAKQLYFNEIFQDIKHPNYYNTELDTNEINKILKIIQTVYNSNSPQKDTVFNIYKIHGYYCYSFSSIILSVDTELPEIQNLANSIFPTGNLALDKLLNTYNFDSVKTSYGYPEFPYITIYTNSGYNMIPIEKEFSELQSIKTAEFNKGCVGDGNTIELIRLENSAIITFSIGQGDCPAGCIYHRYWEFTVSNGEAIFNRAY